MSIERLTCQRSINRILFHFATIYHSLEISVPDPSLPGC